MAVGTALRKRAVVEVMVATLQTPADVPETGVATIDQPNKNSNPAAFSSRKTCSHTIPQCNQLLV